VVVDRAVASGHGCHSDVVSRADCCRGNGIRGAAVCECILFDIVPHLYRQISHNESRYAGFFLPRGAMLARLLATALCLSV